ncbi:MAG: GYF domain-containing protein [Verrucomicrobiota bacterium]
MTELAPDAWFFTREGERLGPVSLAELRVKAQEGGLNPRLDLVWTQGMAEWKPAGQIDTLFERRVTEVPTANPYMPPQAESVGAQMQLQGDWPGARRRAYLTATLLLPVVWNMALGFAPALLGRALEPALLQQINLGGALLLFIIGLYYGLQRLVNLGMSRWWYLGHLVPFLNLWVGYRCFACPAGYAYHKKMDGIGIALAILYWLLIVAVLLALVVLVVILIKYANDPRVADLLRQVREALRARPVLPAP